MSDNERRAEWFQICLWIGVAWALWLAAMTS